MVSLRRRQIFVPFGRIREVSAEGAQLLGGTVDLDPFTQRTGEMLASSLYGRRTPSGTVPTWRSRTASWPATAGR